METISQKYIKEILRYDKKSGKMFWKVSKGARIKIGDVAGSYNKKSGYYNIKINKRMYRLHRIIWLYVHGAFPKDCIDHIDMDKTNNKISNLREAYFLENQHNRNKQENNTSGYKGVSFYKPRGLWRVQAKFLGTVYHVGYFKKIKEAAKAYKDFCKKHHGEFYKI